MFTQPGTVHTGYSGSVTFTLGEDLHQARTGTGPHVLAVLRNLTLNILRLTGHINIARALPQYANTYRPSNQATHHNTHDFAMTLTQHPIGVRQINKETGGVHQPAHPFVRLSDIENRIMKHRRNKSPLLGTAGCLTERRAIRGSICLIVDVRDARSMSTLELPRCTAGS